MLRKFLLLPILSLFFTAGALADDWQNFIPNRQTLMSFDTFRGDQHGQFKGDLVVCLSDDSAWKVHPTEKDKVSRWMPNDVVYLAKRKTFYWFKREHKFELINQSRNETVKVMLVQYPRIAPLQVVLAETYLKDRQYVPYTYSSNGRTYTTYFPQDTYERKIALNDGSVWIISDTSDKFSIGNKVYLGVNADKSDFKFFLITGLEREANWTWARKQN